MTGRAVVACHPVDTARAYLWPSIRLTRAAPRSHAWYDRALFGRRSFGAISSILDPFHKGGLGFGALFAGIGFDYAGNYRVIFVVFLTSYLISALLIFLARRPTVIRNVGVME